MFYDDYDAGRDQGRGEGYYEGIQYAIDLLKSEAAEMWRQDAIRITLAQPTAQKLDVLVEVLKKEQAK